MAWETREGRGRYYTRSFKIAGRVHRQYVGSGYLGEAAAKADADARAEWKAVAEVLRAIRAEHEGADAPLAAFNRAVEALTRAALHAAGFQQHHRGDWRRKRKGKAALEAKEEPHRTSVNSAVVNTEPGDLVEGNRALTDVMRQASAGDEDALARVTKFLDAVPGAYGAIADLSIGAERAWVKLVAGDDPLLRTVLQRTLAELRREVEGPTPTPLEHLLAERVVVTWLAVQHADAEAAEFFGEGGTLAQAGYHQERQERAQRRYLASIQALARVRRLLGPTL